MTEPRFPHDLKAEAATVGAVLVHGDVVLEVPWLRPEQFYRDAHAETWRAIQALVADGIAIDLVTLADALRKAGTLDRIGGVGYLTSLVDGLPRSTNIAHYAAIVRDKWVLREVLQAGDRMALAAADPEQDAASVLAEAEAAILRLGQGTSTSDLVAAADAISAVTARLEVLLDTKTGVTGIATGLADLDRMTRGLQRSDLIVLAGRPSMGKSSLALNLAAHVARTQGPVAVFSLEMTRDALLMREVIADARVSANRVLGGYLNQSEYQAISDSLARAGTWPLWIDDGGETTVLEMRSKARRLKHRAGLALVVIDYLQLMHGEKRAENRTLELAAMTRGFKALAKELDVPVLLLSQLNRAVEGRGDKRPTLGDLRESGAIEQDADVVLMLYRDEYYNPQSSDVGIAEVIVAKARNGPTGTVKLAFIGEQTRFGNLEDRR